MSTHPRVVVSQYYISNTSQHVKNERHYAVFVGEFLWLNKLQMETL